MRPTSCTINLSAVRYNVALLAELVAPTALCAVVKADGYGHGAVQVAKEAIAAGASWLAVALVEEGIELREAGIAEPILLLSEPPIMAMRSVVDHALVPSLYTSDAIAAMAHASVGRGPIPVQLVVDTGMHRVGADPAELGMLSAEIDASADLVLDAVWTHCPVADELDNPFTDDQVQRFDAARGVLPRGIPSHIANSAFAISRPDHGASMVRCGISIYGIDPAPELGHLVGLEPALRLRSEVSSVKQIEAGESVGYGHRWTADVATTIATVPIGYGDGVRRDLGLRGGMVLVGGEHHQIVGVVTMDQLMVDVGSATIRVGDEVVLIGSQGRNEITAANVAATLDTIGYEVVCAIGKRVPRNYVHPTGAPTLAEQAEPRLAAGVSELRVRPERLD